MKKICWLVLAGLVAVAAGPPSAGAEKITAEKIVASCAEAMGGWAKIDAITTLRLKMIYPDHEGQIRTEIKRPNRSRNGDVVVFDGKRAALLERAPEADGTPRPAELVDTEEWKDFEVMIGFSFPAFFDYPSEYLGVEYIEGIETHKLRVTLPLGGRLLYYIEAATSLPFKVESHVTMHGKKLRSERITTDYRETAGILYPHAFTYFSPKVRKMFTVTIEELEINVPLHDDRFRVPTRLIQGK
jgi:hypothetical protein